MESSVVISALSALAQETRLNAFRLLVKREPEGISAGELARLLSVPQNTLSTHLSILLQAGLATSERYSRSIVYRAKLDSLRHVVVYLLRDCCDGNAELCQPLINELTQCCQPSGACHA